MLAQSYADFVQIRSRVDAIWRITNDLRKMPVDSKRNHGKLGLRRSVTARDKLCLTSQILRRR
jgi:hypothetical protein